MMGKKACVLNMVLRCVYLPDGELDSGVLPLTDYVPGYFAFCCSDLPPYVTF